MRKISDIRRQDCGYVIIYMKIYWKGGFDSV